jgi:hypothetical protein
VGTGLAWTPGLFTFICLLVSIIYGAWQLSPIFWAEAGNDSRVFFAAARVSSAGGNPYDFGQLSAMEARLNAEARAEGTGRDSLSPNEYHYPPLLTRGWQLLAPLGDIGFLVANSLLALVAGLIGFELVLMALDWRGRWLVRGFFLFSLPMLTVLSSGNPATVLLLPWAGALLVSRRGRPVLAGALLACCWIKPPVGIPVALALVLVQRHQWRALLAGFGIGTMVFAAVNLAAGGVDGTVAWIQSLVDFSATINAGQTAIIQQRFLAGLSAFFFFLGPVVAGAIALALAGGIVVAVWRRRPAIEASAAAPLGLAVLTAAALAIAPYIHTYDLVFEAVPVLTLAALSQTRLTRTVLVAWGLAPVINLTLALVIAAVTGGLDTPWSYGAVLNALTLLAVAVAVSRYPLAGSGTPASYRR